MSVHERKDGRVFVKYWDPASGKNRYESFGREEGAMEAATTRDLEIKLAKRRGTFAAGGGISYTELLQRYVDARQDELSERTISQILTAAAAYALPVIGSRAARSLGMADLQRILDRMGQKHIKARTKNVYCHYFHKPLRWAVEEAGLLEHDPWRNRRNQRNRREKFEIQLFTLDEFNRILGAASAHLAWAMLVAYHTGVRTGPSELFSIQWSDVDWSNGRIRIYGQKTGKTRWQYIDPAFLERMRRRQRLQARNLPGCPWICHYRGRRISSLKRAWKESKEAAGITRRLRLYDIRHYHITYALASGADLVDLAERVGNSPKMILEVYAHLAKDLQRQAPHDLPHPRRRRKRKDHPPEKA